MEWKTHLAYSCRIHCGMSITVSWDMYFLTPKEYKETRNTNCGMKEADKVKESHRNRGIYMIKGAAALCANLFLLPWHSIRFKPAFFLGNKTCIITNTTRCLPSGVFL